MRYIIDAYSWIEYLEGGEKGEKVHKILKSDNEIFVLPITIAEVISKVKRSKKNTQLAYESIISKAKIINSTPKIAKEAGLLHAEKRKKVPQFGIVDAFLVILARITGAKVLTGDNHFKGFKEATFL